MIRIACLLSLLAVVDAVDVNLVSTPKPAVGDLVEWEISLPPADTTLTLSITADNADTAAKRKIIKRPAFRYRPFRNGDLDTPFVAEFIPTGPETLRVRHVFRTPGAHTLALTAADEAEPVWRGTLTIAPSTEPAGPITISPTNPNLLAFSDGTPVILIGCNIAWGHRPNRIADMKRHFADLAAAGGNHVRIWCASWCGQIDGERPGEIRLEQAWQLDQILAAARHHKLFVTLVLDNHHDLTHGKMSPYGTTPRERIETFFDPQLAEGYRQRIAYLMARYGADDSIAAWELFNEIDLAFMDQPFSKELPDPATTSAAWANAAGHYILDNDPDQRLITISLSREVWPDLFAQPAIDLVQVHRYVPSYGLQQTGYHDAVDLLDEAMDPYRDIGKPMLASEVGHHGNEEINPGNRVDKEGIVLWQQAWSGLLLGGYGSGMNWWWDNYITSQDLWHLYTPLAKVVAEIDWHDGMLQPMQPNRGSSLRILGWRSPDQALVWPQIRNDTWHNLIITKEHSHYGVNGPLIRLTGMRENSRFQIRAIDMLTGVEAWNTEASSDAEGAITVRLAPQCGRQVLVVERSGG